MKQTYKTTTLVIGLAVVLMLAQVLFGQAPPAQGGGGAPGAGRGQAPGAPGGGAPGGGARGAGGGGRGGGAPAVPAGPVVRTPDGKPDMTG
jgi:hypothetical protein